MRKGKGAAIMDYFETLEDPIDRCKRHQLLESLPLPFAPSSAAPTWVYIERQEQAGMVPHFPGTAPRHPVPRHLRRRLLPAGPGAVPAVLHGLDQAVSDLIPGEVVAIDGKTVRRSHDRNFGPAGHPPGQRLGLGQHADPGAGEDRGEVQRNHRHPPVAANAGTAGVHQVTIDAMGCQQEIAQGILDRGAGYVLALKENQGQLYEDVRDLFEGAAEFGFEGVPHDYATTLNKDHGRIERRECWTISDPACLEYLSTGQDWPGLCSVVKVVGRRETPAGTTVQPRYYISSLEAPAERLLGVVRTHWSIENSLHWSLDVTFGEDHCRIRKDHAPQNMATLRQVSHNLLKNETSLKVGIQGKRLQAGWKEDYLLKVLRS